MSIDVRLNLLSSNTCTDWMILQTTRYEGEFFVKIDKILLPAGADASMFSEAQKMIQLVKDVEPSYEKIVIERMCSIQSNHIDGDVWREEYTHVFSKNVLEERNRVLKCTVTETKNQSQPENVLELAWVSK